MHLLAPELEYKGRCLTISVNIKLPERRRAVRRRPYSVHAVERRAGVIELLFNTARPGQPRLGRAYARR